MNDISTEKLEFVNLARKIIGSLSESCLNEKYLELEQKAFQVAKNIGFDSNHFLDFRSNKTMSNGAFSKRFILSEKVLPINKSTESNKIIRDDRRDVVSGAHEKSSYIDSYGRKSIPEKLVRDRIPETIEKQAITNGLLNYNAKVRKASVNEFPKFIQQKFEEESNEFLAAIEPPDQLEDLIDILDVVQAGIVNLNK